MAERGSLGGVHEEEIKALTEESVGPPSEAGASPLTRFVRKLSRLVGVRAERGEGGEISIFLKSEALADDLDQRESEEAPLIINGNVPISGRIWLSDAGLVTVFALKLNWNDLGSLYQAIRDAGLGKLPAFVVDWQAEKPVARLYPRGLDLDSGGDDILIDLTDDPITPDDMRATLGHFYQTSLKTPALSVGGHANRVWKNARRGIPEERPEQRIHGRLMEALRARYSQHNVRPEVNTDEGRVDVVIWSETADPSGRPAMRHDWVLELKTLTDRTTNGKAVSKSACKSKLNDGLIQATAYRSYIRALQAAVCCYDMRKDDIGDKECFKSIAHQARADKIELWRWYLYRSLAKARRAQYAAKGD